MRNGKSGALMPSMINAGGYPMCATENDAATFPHGYNSIGALIIRTGFWGPLHYKIAKVII